MNDLKERRAKLAEQEATNARLFAEEIAAARAKAEAALSEHGEVTVRLYGHVWQVVCGKRSVADEGSIDGAIQQHLDILARKAKPVTHERPMPADPEPEAPKPPEPPPEVVKNAPEPEPVVEEEAASEPEPVVVAEPDPETVAWADLIPPDASPEQIAEVRGGLLARWRYFQHFRIDSARSARDRALPDLSDEERVEFEDLERRNAIFKWLD